MLFPVKNLIIASFFSPTIITFSAFSMWSCQTVGGVLGVSISAMNNNQWFNEECRSMEGGFFFLDVFMWLTLWTKRGRTKGSNKKRSKTKREGLHSIAILVLNSRRPILQILPRPRKLTRSINNSSSSTHTNISIHSNFTLANSVPA